MTTQTLTQIRTRVRLQLANAAPASFRYLNDVAIGDAKGQTHRMTAARFILEHTLGKPAQYIEVDIGDGAVDDNFGRYTELELRDMLQASADKDRDAAITKQNALDKLAIESTATPVAPLLKGAPAHARDNDAVDIVDAVVIDDNSPIIITESMRYLWADSADKRTRRGDDNSHNIAAILSDNDA